MNTKRRAEKPSTAHLPEVPTASEPKSAHRSADSQGMDGRAQEAPIPKVHKKQRQIIKYEESEAHNPDIALDCTAPGIAASATAEHSVTGASDPCDVKAMIRDAVYHSAGGSAVGGPLPCPLNPQVNVDGIGELRFPLAQETLQSLAAMMKQDVHKPRHESVTLEGVGAAGFTTGAQWNDQFLPVIIKSACGNLGVNASHWGVEARASALLCHHPDIHTMSRPSDSTGDPVPYLTREELNDPTCGWTFHLKAPDDNHAFATVLVPLAQPFTGGDLAVFPFDPLDELIDDDADFTTKSIPLHPKDGGSPVYAASFNAPYRIALNPVKSGARVMLVCVAIQNFYAYVSSMLRNHLLRTLHLTDPLPTDACSLNVSANLITAAAAWVKADIPRQIAFVLEYECDDKTYGSMPSFDMLEGHDAALAQLLREVCDGDGQPVLRGSPMLRLQRYLPDAAQASGQEAGAQKTWSISL